MTILHVKSRSANRLAYMGVCLGVVAAVLTGCSYVTATKTSSADKATRGIRYWLAEPYLLVKAPIELYKKEELFQIDQEGNKLSAVDPKGGAPKGLEAPTQVPPSTEATPTGSELSVVWLPDYCEQYALQGIGFLSSLTMNVKLADGWKLDSADSVANSAELPGKIVDAIAAVKSAKAGAAAAPSAAEVKMAMDLMENNQNKPGTRAFVKRVTATALQPGLYRVFSKAADCTGGRSFDPATFNTNNSVVWVPFVMTPK